jgi:molybdenum cofactor biosynthesis protein B
MAAQQHQRSADEIVARCAVVTLSDTRTAQTDTSGPRIRRLLRETGHAVVYHQVCRAEPMAFEALLMELLGRADVDAVFTTGGTGISSRDRTCEIVARHLDQELPGFGELFRMLSWQQLGSSAMLTRAVGGMAKDKVVFAMPGSTKAVELAMSQLILPQLRHLLHELRK